MSVIILKTGRRLDVNCGIVGISEKLDVYGGYDESVTEWDKETLGCIDENDPEDEQYRKDNGIFAEEERRELADLMIARWEAFRKREKPHELS